jgi:hypothetical protein
VVLENMEKQKGILESLYIYIPLVNIQQTMENHGTSPFLMSKSTINGPFSLWSSTRIRDEPQSRRPKEDAEDEVC